MSQSQHHTHTSLKPAYTPFVIYPVIRWGISFSVFLGIIFTITTFFFPLNPLYFISVFALLAGWTFLSLHVQYSKEQYEFENDRITYRSGGIFSDNETQLLMRNITHVIMNKPFIEYGLFKTGSILVQSAGSGDVEVELRHIGTPEDTYTHIQNMMQHNGFQLDMKHVVQQEKPSPIGVFFEVFQGYIGTIVSIFFFSMYFSGLVWEFAAAYSNIVIIGVLIVLILMIFPSIIAFLDLSKRVYRVYQSTISYSEGFLNKTEAFLPMENLADSTVSQTFIDRIFSLYDVIISCQGSNQEIVFKNMANGPKLEEHIERLSKELDALVSRKTNKDTPQKQEEKEDQQSTVTRHNQEKDIPQGHTWDESITGSYTMDMTKTLVTNLILLPGAVVFFPLLFGWIAKFLNDIIRASGTKYSIRERSIQEYFSFINKKTKEFSIDKVMGIEVSESFIDTWFSTCTITFWSIGSTETISFRNVKKTDTLLIDIRKKFGYVSTEQPLYTLQSRFTIIAMLAYGIFGTVIGGILFAISFFIGWLRTPWMLIPAVLIAVYYVCIALYRRAYFDRSHLDVLPHFVHFSEGLLIQKQTFVLLDNIKDITTVKYPFFPKGNIQFNVAGEQIVQNGQNQTMKSNSFTIKYVDNIQSQDEILDLIFFKRPSHEEVQQMMTNIDSFHEKAILKAQPSVANAMAGLITLSVILFPLLLILPFTLIWTIWSVKVTSYRLESYRVVSRWGIIFKTQSSIISHKIDHINKEQGLWNKAFNNGTVTIHTIGSSQPELELKNMPNYKEVYEELHKQYM